MSGGRWSQAHVSLVTGEPPASLPEALCGEINSDEARQALVRGRLEICGPTTARRIAAELGMEPSGVQIALEQLELAGAVLRGQFTREATELEWCERRLLARIHRLTLDGLRRQVAPVDAAGCMRFLLSHHEVSSASRPAGVGGLRRVVDLLEGFESPVAAWEHDLLPARMDFEPEWLDQLFGRGEVVWGRLQPPRISDDGRGQILTRLSPISLAARGDLSWLLPVEREVSAAASRWDAQEVYAALEQHGALFFDDLLAVTKLLPAQLEDALRELAAMGLVTSDGFAAVRAICMKSKPANSPRRRRSRDARRTGAYSQGGRWSKFPLFTPVIERAERVEKWAWLLLRRYGVMFRDLLARESLAPTWGELARVYRRLEMRGEIRGGRFVSGVGGEQFALPESVEQLRKMREEPEAENWCVVSAADPLNLVGILTTAVRVPALRGNRIAFLNGRPIAAREGREIRWLADVDDAIRQRAERLLATPGVLRRESIAERLSPSDWSVDALLDVMPS